MLIDNDRNKEKYTLLSRTCFLVVPAALSIFFILQSIVWIDFKFSASPICNSSKQFHHWTWYGQLIEAGIFAMSIWTQCSRMCWFSYDYFDFYSPFFTTLCINFMAGTSSLLILIWGGGGICEDSFGIRTPAALWPEWIVCTPMLFYVSFSCENKPHLSKKEKNVLILIVLVFIIGFLLNVVHSVILGGFLLGSSLICYISVLYLVFEINSQIVAVSEQRCEDSDTYTRNHTLTLAHNQLTLSALLCLFTPTFVISYLLCLGGAYSSDVLFVVTLVCNSSTKVIFATVAMDLHLQISHKSTNNLAAFQRRLHTRNLFNQMLHNATTTSLRTIAVGLQRLHENRNQNRSSSSHSENQQMLFSSAHSGNCYNGSENKDDHADAIMMILKSTGMIENTLQDLFDSQCINLDLSDASTTNLAKKDIILKDFIQNIILSFQPEFRQLNVQFSATIYPDIAHVVYGDSMRLTYVVMSLISNAIQNISYGDSIQLEVSSENFSASTWRSDIYSPCSGINNNNYNSSSGSNNITVDVNGDEKELHSTYQEITFLVRFEKLSDNGYRERSGTGTGTGTAGSVRARRTGGAGTKSSARITHPDSDVPSTPSSSTPLFRNKFIPSVSVLHSMSKSHSIDHRDRVHRNSNRINRYRRTSGASSNIDNKDTNPAPPPFDFSLCREIVRLHGGRMSSSSSTEQDGRLVTSESFTVLFPVVQWIESQSSSKTFPTTTTAAAAAASTCATSGPRQGTRTTSPHSEERGGGTEGGEEKPLARRPPASISVSKPKPPSPVSRRGGSSWRDGLDAVTRAATTTTADEGVAESKDETVAVTVVASNNNSSSNNSSASSCSAVKSRPFLPIMFSSDGSELSLTKVALLTHMTMTSGSDTAAAAAAAAGTTGSTMTPTLQASKEMRPDIIVKVMIVNGSYAHSKMLGLLLGKSQCRSDLVRDLPEALTNVSQRFYDLIIVDDVSRVGYGAVVVSGLRAAGFTRIILGFTGSLYDDGYGKVLRAGADLVLPIPTRPAALAVLVAFIRREGSMSRPGHKIKLAEDPEATCWISENSFLL